jgi:truncated hemoglobin YjbI
VHPDVEPTNALVASLRTRAARLGITDEQFGAWLETMHLPQEHGRLRLTVGERQRLSLAFNQAIDATKAQQAAAAATDTKRQSRRKAATGD